MIRPMPAHQGSVPENNIELINDAAQPPVLNAVDRYGPWMLVTKPRRARRNPQQNILKIKI